MEGQEPSLDDKDFGPVSTHMVDQATSPTSLDLFHRCPLSSGIWQGFLHLG